MKPNLKQVLYSYEHGDKSLPHLKDLVSATPDPMKGKILAYLRTYNVYACPGSIRDEIYPEKSIGCGDTYTDGVYYWNDAFINYVNIYNIPVPEEFRSHILTHYNHRMKRHTLLQLIDQVDIHNNPDSEHMYDIRINKSGSIITKGIKQSEETIAIDADEAKTIINPIMAGIFCYDSDNHGVEMIDGYHWALTFYKKGEVIDKFEGYPCEDIWRYDQFKMIINYTESKIHKDLGSGCMNYYDTPKGM